MAIDSRRAGATIEVTGKMKLAGSCELIGYDPDGDTLQFAENVFLTMAEEAGWEIVSQSGRVYIQAPHLPTFPRST